MAKEQKTETSAAPAPQSNAEKIEAWFAERIHGSPIARDTEAYNYVRKAVDDLKAILS